MKNLGIICGGFSSEYEISLKSANTILKHLPDAYKGYMIVLSDEGWLVKNGYNDGVFDLKAYLRSGVSDEEVKKQLLTLFNKRPLDGFEAENKRIGVITESMTTIGG